MKRQLPRRISWTCFALRIKTLTPRERQVFELVIRGQTNKANALGGTERTIKAHRVRVMEKMQPRSWLNWFPLAERVGVLDSLPSSSRKTA
jgi:FixJ family two-component response regulator